MREVKGGKERQRSILYALWCQTFADALGKTFTDVER